MGSWFPVLFRLTCARTVRCPWGEDGVFMPAELVVVARAGHVVNAAVAAALALEQIGVSLVIACGSGY